MKQSTDQIKPSGELLSMQTQLDASSWRIPSETYHTIKALSVSSGYQEQARRMLRLRRTRSTWLPKDSSRTTASTTRIMVCLWSNAWQSAWWSRSTSICTGFWINPDAVTAFLYRAVKENTYCAVPEGVAMDSGHECMEAVKPIYGLKKASWLWNEKLNELMCPSDFKCLPLIRVSTLRWSTAISCSCASVSGRCSGH